MNKDLKMNYISLALAIFLTFFMGLIYLLLSKSMVFPLKVGYAVLALVIFLLIVFNIVTIIKKLNM